MLAVAMLGKIDYFAFREMEPFFIMDIIKKRNEIMTPEEDKERRATQADFDIF